MPRIPTRAIFSDFCASAASGRAKSTAPEPARNVRRSIRAPSRGQSASPNRLSPSDPMRLLGKRRVAYRRALVGGTIPFIRR